MMRRWVLTGVALLFVLGGCASDERKERVLFTLGLMETTKTKIGSIKEAITAATTQMATDKDLNLAEAYKKCEDLKDFCKKAVQKQAEDIRTARLNVSDAQKEEYKEEFKKEINDKIKALYTETLALDKAVKTLEEAVNKQDFKAEKRTDDEVLQKQDDAKKAVKDLKKKLEEAQAEFETLSRKSQ